MAQAQSGFGGGNQGSMENKNKSETSPRQYGSESSVGQAVDRQVKQVTETAREAVEWGEERAKDAVDWGQRRADEAMGQTRDYITQNPFAACAIAAGVGFLLGMLIRR